MNKKKHGKENPTKIDEYDIISLHDCSKCKYYECNIKKTVNTKHAFQEFLAHIGTS